MARNYRIEYVYHEDTGNLGFRLKGRNWMDPGEAFTLVHDVLEHRPGDTGRIHQELMALGAAWWVRDFEYVTHELGMGLRLGRIDLAKMLAQEFTFIAAWDPDFRGFHRAPRHRSGYDEWDRVEALLKEVADWIPRIGKQEGWIEDGQAKHPLFDSKWEPEILAWIEHGFWLAQKRYRGINSINLAHPFVEMVRRGDELMKEAYEGDEFSLWIDIRPDINALDWSWNPVRRSW